MYAAAYRNTERGISAIRGLSEQQRMEVERHIDEAVKRAASLEMAKQFDRLLGLKQPAGQIDRIINRICRALRVKRNELISTRKSNKVVLARQAVCYWAARITPLSYPVIGRKLGRDHTTVLHGKREYPKKRAAMGRHLPPVR